MNRFAWLVLIIFFVLFSFAPTFYELSQRDKLSGRSFELVHNYITDYNFYLSRIREGWEGRWTVVERYTSEPHTGSFFQIFYLLLGRLARPMTWPEFAIPSSYHTARVVFGILLLTFIAWLAKRMFSSILWQVLGFLLVVTASTWPIAVPIPDGSWRIGGYMPWWTVMDSLQRITFLPHLLAGQTLILFLIIAGTNREVMARPGNWIFLGFLAFLLGTLFPPGLFFVAVVYGVSIVLSFVFDKPLRVKEKLGAWCVREIVPKVIIGICSLPTVVYFQRSMSIYPWKRLLEFDQLNPTVFSYLDYAKALGPVFIFGMVGLVLVLLGKDRKWFSFGSWVIAWILCMVVFKFVPQQSPLRFTEMGVHVPLAMLTAYLCYFLYKRAKRAEVGVAFFALRIAIFLIPIILIILGMGTMISSFFWQKDFVDQKVHASNPAISRDNYIVYPASEFMDIIGHIALGLPADAVILSDLTAGNYIPAYTGRTVYVGHDNTVKKEEKRDTARLFFQGKMGAKEALQWMRGERISYVFFGPEEQDRGGLKTLESAYPFLKRVYKKANVILYSVL
jgi:hypothetical protein